MPAPHFSRTPLAAAVAALLALGATGCAEADPAPRTLPALATPTVSATPHVPPVPVEAEAVTPQGAAAFARHWFDALNSAISTGRSGELRALSAVRCRACDRFADDLEETYRAGGRFRGCQFDVQFAEAPAIEDPAAAAVTVIYNISDCDRIGPDGSVAQRTPPSRRLAGEVVLARRGQSWLMTSFVQQS